VREQLVAWAEDCRVSGGVDLVEGRLSDQVNEEGMLTFFSATLESLDDGHTLAVDELEVERRELALIEVEGRRGDSSRRLRTIRELVELQLGPFRITGNLHRSPSAQPFAALSRWARFVPLTDAVVVVAGRAGDPLRRDVVLVNRERIERSEPLVSLQIEPRNGWSGLPDAGGVASGPEVQIG
jgi:hypothetical protein